MNYSIKHTPLVAAMLLALNSPLYSPLAMAAGDTLGGEIPVNTTIANNQIRPSIALDANGDFVIVWQGNGSGDSDGIYAKRYSANGSLVIDEFRVNTTTVSGQSNPSIALDADGDFVIAWQGNGLGDNNGIYAQRYTADGSSVGGEFLVNTTAAGFQGRLSIAMDVDGDFVIVWLSNGSSIYGQRYTADGSLAGDEFPITTTANILSHSSIAMDADGDFVVAWDGSGSGDNVGIYARRYNADGSPAGGESRVNTTTAGFQGRPSIAMDADGNFVIAWEGNGSNDDNVGIYAQRYTANGSRVAGEFRVNIETVNNQRNPSIALDADGDFVIAWESYQDGGGLGIYAQRYTADGSPAGGEFRVNTETTNIQRASSIALDADGDFVIAWESYGQDDSPNNNGGIYAQRYNGETNFEGATSFAVGNVNLNLVVQDDTDPVTVGNNFVYSLVTTNNGSGIALDINLSDVLPAGLTYVSDDGASFGWNCALSTATLNCNKPFMNVADISTISVTVTADTAGTLSNSASVNAAQTDVDVSDNADTETTEVTTASSGGGGGSFGIFTLLLALPLWLRRHWLG